MKKPESKKTRKKNRKKAKQQSNKRGAQGAAQGNNGSQESPGTLPVRADASATQVVPGHRLSTTWPYAFFKATIWTFMWTAVVFITAAFEREFTKNVEMQIVALVTSFGYIGSVGAEAVIRYFDEFPRSRDTAADGIALGQVGASISFMIVVYFLIGITESTGTKEMRFQFTSAIISEECRTVDHTQKPAMVQGASSVNKRVDTADTTSSSASGSVTCPGALGRIARDKKFWMVLFIGWFFRAYIYHAAGRRHQIAAIS